MQRVLVVLPNWFGETLFATPFLRALRTQQPAAFIAALGRPACRQILSHSPLINELIEWDELGAQRGPVGAWRLSRALASSRFDTAFILRRSLTRSLIARFAGIRRLVGWSGKGGWLLTDRVPPASAPRHKAVSYLPLLEAAGLAAESRRYEYTVTDAERQAARAWLRQQGLGDGRALVILHPGANWPHKRWAPERFAQLGDRLAESRSAQIAVTGGPEDTELAHAVRSRMRRPALIFAGQTTLRQLAACLEQARLVVSNDTGVLHLAAAMDRPLVALYGPTSPALTGPLGMPDRTVILHHPEGCPRVPCLRPDRPPHPGMDAISVEEACEAAVGLLERAG